MSDNASPSHDSDEPADASRPGGRREPDDGVDAPPPESEFAEPPDYSEDPAETAEPSPPSESDADPDAAPAARRPRRAPVRPKPVATRNLAQRNAEARAPEPNESRLTVHHLLRSAGVACLVAWLCLLTVSTFTETMSGGTGGPAAVFGVVLTFLLTGAAISASVAFKGVRVILIALATALLAAGAGWMTFNAMPEAGPGSFISHRAGIATLAYAFGVMGGCLIALSEFVVDGYVGARVKATRWLRWKSALVGATVVAVAAVAIIPAMHEWAEGANTEAEHNSSPVPTGLGSFRDQTRMDDGVEDFVSAPGGLLRIDGADGTETPQAVTLLDPVTGDEYWHYRRWNWQMGGGPLFNDDRGRVALAGRRFDNADEYGVRVLETATGKLVDEKVLSENPGELVAYDGAHYAFADRSDPQTTAVSVYAAEGGHLWRERLPQNCRGVRFSQTPGTLVAVADCSPSPEQPEAASWVYGYDPGTGELRWEDRIDPAFIVEENGVVATDGAVIVDARRETRLTDGPFSARRFTHRLVSIDTAEGERNWVSKAVNFGSTHTSACGGTLFTNETSPLTPQAVAAANAKDRADGGKPDGKAGGGTEATVEQRVQVIECFTKDAKNRLGVRTFSTETGRQLSAASAPMGFSPTEPETLRSWVTVLPDGRTVAALDKSSNQKKPACTLWEVDGKKARALDEMSDGLPKGWCHSARLDSNDNAVVLSYDDPDEGRQNLVIN
ncbi:outer membrane protein assembly factor BamB family protein [Salininema proteolyticum]|uniref:PQQ-binding-like beta-propeller repeat protein n=1 Tax=Salininema proteolyticum TaxID=1607685 RepID=A0ABV8TTB9_9ACTN